MSDFHALGGELGLRLPPEFQVQLRPNGLTARHSQHGWQLSAIRRSVTADADPKALHAALAQSLIQRAPALSELSPILEARGRGWDGLASRLGTSDRSRNLQLLSVMLPPGEAEPAQLVLILDAGADPLPQGLPMGWLGLRELRSGIDGLLSPKPTLALEDSAPGPTGRASFQAREPTRPLSALPTGKAEPVAAPGTPPPMPEVADPWRAPETRQLEERADDEALLLAGQGQRILVWCVLLAFLTRNLQRSELLPEFFGWAAAVALMAWAFRGVLMIASGFGYERGRKLALLFASTLPLIGIGTWIWLSLKTTRALREAGYEVGLFGVKG